MRALSSSPIGLKTGREEIDFSWHGTIRGEEDGTVSFSMDGQARTTFWKNRIGFCVLFPANCSGQPATIEHSDGTKEETEFPVDICADQPVSPFSDLQSVAQPLGQDEGFEVRFEGDVFEMEDQRLWTDASYKVFCTPINQPYPVEIRAGSHVAQSVMVKVCRPANLTEKAIPNSVERPAMVSLYAYPQAWRPLPEIGLGMASHGEALSTREIERLKALHLHHLRVDLRLADTDYPFVLRQATLEAGALGALLEAALLVTAEKSEEELKGLRRLLDDLQPPVGCWLVYPAREIYAGGSPTELVLLAARKYLQDYRPGIPFAAGTNTDYIFLKRTPPPVSSMDRVCIALNPQVHAFDNRSLVETLEAQPMVVDSARRLANGLPVIVSPITLKPRFNPYATGPAPVTPPGLSRRKSIHARRRSSAQVGHWAA